MAEREALTAAYVRSILYYDPETGVFTWRARPASMFNDGKHSAAHRASLWNSRYSGTVAGKIDDRGYRIICISSRMYRAHRLAWLWMAGDWPTAEIDHVNLDKDDNCWSNLREATHSQNMINRRLHRNNTSGCKGVHWHKRDKKWSAQISKDKRRINLGYFETREDAQSARKEAAERLHGGYVRYG